MTNQLRQAAQQALEALVKSTGELHRYYSSPTDMQILLNHKAITALKAALEQPEQELVKLNEPVISAWSLREVYFDEDGEPLMHRSQPAAEPEQEPVAYYHPHKGFYWAKPTHISAPTVVDVPPVPLYTTLPAAQRPWVGLTDEEIQELRLKSFDAIATNHEIYRAIEAKLRSKNNE
jgi:hypothetical protein